MNFVIKMLIYGLISVIFFGYEHLEGREMEVGKGKNWSYL